MVTKGKKKSVTPRQDRHLQQQWRQADFVLEIPLSHIDGETATLVPLLLCGDGHPSSTHCPESHAAYAQLSSFVFEFPIKVDDACWLEWKASGPKAQTRPSRTKPTRTTSAPWK